MSLRPFTRVTARLSAFLAAAALLQACHEHDGPLPKQVDERGQVISYAESARYTKDEILSIMSGISPILPSAMPPRFGAVSYIVEYKTVDPLGHPTTASGMVVVPDAPSPFPYAMASYQHGTVLHKAGVPTLGGGEWQLGLILAADGYICSMPDYLGLGTGPGFHPYVHAKSEASASVDMLRASRSIVGDLGLEWNRQLFLFGYSQGGHATMALHRAIQHLHGDEFQITASAPMAGPYDASGVQEQVITGTRPYPTPGYLPFIIYSYDMVYDIIEEPPYSMFKAPYDSIVRVNMDQTVDIGTLNSILPAVPREMVKDSIMAAYEADSDHPLKRALRDNDLWDWAPRGHMRICYCDSDDQVSYRNSILAHERFMERGSSPDEIRLMQIAVGADHGQCALPSMLYAKYFFDSLRVE